VEGENPTKRRWGEERTASVCGRLFHLDGLSNCVKGEGKRVPPDAKNKKTVWKRGGKETILHCKDVKKDQKNKGREGVLFLWKIPHKRSRRLGDSGAWRGKE